MLGSAALVWGLWGGRQTRDETKPVSGHEYEPAAFTAITVSATLTETAVIHEETPTPEEESQLTAGLVTSHVVHRRSEAKGIREKP